MANTAQALNEAALKYDILLVCGLVGDSRYFEVVFVVFTPEGLRLIKTLRLAQVYYLPPTKLREGNGFSRVTPSVYPGFPCDYVTMCPI